MSELTQMGSNVDSERGVAFMSILLRMRSPAQDKRFSTDGRGRPVLPWWFRGPEPINYEGLLGIIPKGGVVDPAPPMR